MKLATKVQRIQNKITELYTELRDIQEHQCDHPDATLEREAMSNSGYDYNDYWYDFHCKICDKRWREDQGPENRNKGTAVRREY